MKAETIIILNWIDFKLMNTEQQIEYNWQIIKIGYKLSIKIQNHIAILTIKII